MRLEQDLQQELGDLKESSEEQLRKTTKYIYLFWAVAILAIIDMKNWHLFFKPNVLGLLVALIFLAHIAICIVTGTIDLMAKNNKQFIIKNMLSLVTEMEKREKQGTV